MSDITPLEQLTNLDKKILRFIWANPSTKIYRAYDAVVFEPEDETDAFAPLWWEKLECLGLIESTGSYKWRCLVDRYGDFIFDTEKYIAELEAEVARLKSAQAKPVAWWSDVPNDAWAAIDAGKPLPHDFRNEYLSCVEISCALPLYLHPPVAQSQSDLLHACIEARKWLSGWASAEPYIRMLDAAIAKDTAAKGTPNAD